MTDDDLSKDVVEQFHGLRRWYRAVVDIAGDEHRGRVDLGDESHQLLEDLLLVSREVDRMEQPPQVPVGGVDESHGRDSTTGSRRRTGRWRLRPRPAPVRARG